MHVVTVTPLYPPQSRVGAWLATHEFMRGLVARGHTVSVLPTFGPPTPYEHDGVQVLPISHLQEELASAAVVVSHLGDNGHAHRQAFVKGIPSVRLVHGGASNPGQLQGAALAVCNSKATERSIASWMGRKVVIHPPTDEGHYATEPGDHVTLVNLSAEKGGEVFWRMAASMPDVQFLGVMGGHGQQIRGNLSNVEVIASTDDMRTEVYARTRVLLMPSFAESWGMVGIEAMCSGIPVLARPTPGLREALGVGGNFQEGHATGAWCSALRALLEPAAWQDASDRALARVAQLNPARQRGQFIQAVEALVPQEIPA